MTARDVLIAAIKDLLNDLPTLFALRNRRLMGDPGLLPFRLVWSINCAFGFADLNIIHQMSLHSLVLISTVFPAPTDRTVLCEVHSCDGLMLCTLDAPML